VREEVGAQLARVNPNPDYMVGNLKSNHFDAQGTFNPT